MYDLFAEQFVNGIVTGSVYAIVAVRMTMIFGVLRAINFAHGEYYMVGTFGAWLAIFYFHLPYPVALGIGVVTTAITAVVVGKLVMSRMVGATAEAGVVATLGISLVLQNIVVLMFGGGYKVFRGGYIQPVSLFGFSLTQQLLILVVCLLVFAGLELLVLYTRIGKSMRAVSQNTEACTVVGIDVQQVVVWAFVLGAALAALAGVLTAPVNVSVYGGMGGLITFKTLPITVMGGLGNVRGTLVAAMLLGISESLVAGYRAAVPGLRRLRDAHPDVDVATAQTVFDPGAVLNDRGSIDVGKRSLGYPMAA